MVVYGCYWATSAWRHRPGFDLDQLYVLLGEAAIGSTVALVSADRDSVLLPSTLPRWTSACGR
ncbi:MAG: hypothetical protein R2711_06700 [Acidimicrobiales bacterium]